MVVLRVVVIINVLEVGAVTGCLCNSSMQDYFATLTELGHNQLKLCVKL